MRTVSQRPPGGGLSFCAYVAMHESLPDTKSDFVFTRPRPTAEVAFRVGNNILIHDQKAAVAYFAARAFTNAGVTRLADLAADPDGHSMATSGRGSGIVGYNVQVAVDAEHHTHVHPDREIDQNE